jgi:multicomponent K+:H+ antiporter subunit A
MLAAIVLVPFAAALVAALMPRPARRGAAIVAGATMLAVVMMALSGGPDVLAGRVLRESVPWLPAVAFGFRLDGLAFAFTLLVGAIGVLVVIYAHYYLASDDPAPRFFAMLLAFTGAMLGIVLADNLVLMVVFWELTSVTSFLLIGYWRHREDARAGARMALAITGGGGLCLLAGVLLLGHIAGGYELDRVLVAGDAIRAHPLYLPTLLLVLLGAFTKSAQVPFQFWLPHAMAAPTPVSAFLHSATMVKAGVFLLARLYPALSGTDAWFWTVTLTGLSTLAFGAWVAIFQQDLKGLLAYSTISHLGLITLLFGLDERLAVVAGVFHIFNHATFKASLFMAAGIIDHETGSRDLRKLNGLIAFMPVTATLAMVAAAAMAGVPLLNGFLSKEMFFAETLSLDVRGLARWLIPAAATLAATFSVAYSMRFIHDVFFNGEPVGLDRTPHEPPRFMRVPVEVLVLVCVAVGLFPEPVIGPLLRIAAGPPLLGAVPEFSLALWHGWNLPLAMSAFALVAGTVLYFGLQRFLNLHKFLPVLLPGKRVFDGVLDASYEASVAIARRLPYLRLAGMIEWIVLAALVAAAWPLLRDGFGAPARLPAIAMGVPERIMGVAIWLFGVAATIVAVANYRRRLVALIAIGAVGLAVSLAFAVLAAPDLALTQLLVEVVTVILMMVALYYLPPESPPEPARGRQWTDGALAVATGVGVAAIAYAVLTRPFDSIAPFYLERALSEGGGTNVVNVIIVDFRGFDTLGEMTVLGIAGLIVWALLAGFRVPATFQPPRPDGAFNPLLVQAVTRLLLPFAVLVAIFLLLRGHNLPGGGFIAGLVLAAALVLTRVAGVGPPPSLGRMPWQSWIAAGLMLAIATGAAAMLLGFPFLTSTFGHPVLPVVGEVPLASAALFDLGVFLAVVGATLLAVMVPGVLRATRTR